MTQFFNFAPNYAPVQSRLRLFVTPVSWLVVLGFILLFQVATAQSGTSRNEVTEFNDLIAGDDTDQVIEVLAGDDAVYADDGSDEVFGGSGDYMLDGGRGNDVLHGGPGNDRLLGTKGDDMLYGNEGDDRLAGGNGNDYLEGGDGVDTLRGGKGNDHLVGGSGDDFLFGEDGIDRLEGGEGMDTYVFDGYDDLVESDNGLRTEIVDAPDGSSRIFFQGGLNAEDIMLVNQPGPDLEIRYAYLSKPDLVSSVFILNGAEGRQIKEFVFSDRTTISFNEFCSLHSDTCSISNAEDR